MCDATRLGGASTTKLDAIMNCPNCGFALSEGLPFCVNCGTAVPQTEAPHALQAQPTESTRPAQTGAQQVQPTIPVSPPAAIQPPSLSPLPVVPQRKSSRIWLWLVALVALACIATVGAFMFKGRGTGKPGGQRVNANAANNSNARIAQAQPSVVVNKQDNAGASGAAQPEPLNQTLTGQTKEITTVAYLPDKKTLASASLDGSVKLWDAQTGALKQTVAEQDGGVVSLAFSSDGATAAVAVVNNGGEGKVFIDDVQGAQLGAVRQQIKRNNIQSVALTSDGKTLAIGNSSGSLTLWDTTTGTLKQTLEGQDIQTRSVVFSPDGRWIAAGGYGNTVKLWDAQTGKLRELQGHTNEITCVAFAPDGQTLASGSYDYTVNLWNAQTGELKHTLKGDENVISAISFAPDGKTLASAANRTISLWDVTTGALRQTFKTPAAAVSALAFAPDGTSLASGCADGTVKLWSSKL
jgi:WD domain, G-beta repeat